MLTVTKILIDREPCPLGVEQNPVFSLTIGADRNDEQPGGVQILVARDLDFAPDSVLWDARCESWLDVEYQGAALLPHSRYYVKARVLDRHGAPCPFGDTAFFETAFFGEEPWQAPFISADCPQESAGVVPCFQFLRTFLLPVWATRAKLYITAKGVYEAHLNGKRVSQDVLTPGWTSYRHHLAYQSYDATPYLRPGENTLSILLGDGWYKGYLTSRWRRNYYGDRRELTCELHLQGADGEARVIRSDESFRWWTTNIEMSEIYNGETCDGVFDPCPDIAAENLRPACVGSIPPPGYLHPAVAAPMRYMEALKPAALLTTPRGETVLDFGRVVAGVVEFAVSGRAGDKVVLQCGDTLDRDGNFYNDNLELFSLDGRERPAMQRIAYRCGGGGREVFRPHFTYQGFRYVHIIEYPGRPSPEDFRAVVISSFHEQTGQFACGNREVNELFQNIAATQRATFLDVPIAGPQRAERLGWTGDAQLITPLACHNMFDARRFFRKWLDDLVLDQREDGQVGTMIPYVVFDETADESDNVGSSAAWGDAAAVVPYELYRFYGERRLLERYCAGARKYVEFMRRSGNEEFLFDQGFCFGDWFALDNGEDAYPGKTSKAMIACFYYYRSTVLLSRMLRELGNAGDADVYAALAQNIRKAILPRFFARDGRLLETTQTGCAMALHFDIAENRPEVAAQLLELLRLDGHLQTGFIGSSIILPVLCSIGEESLAYDLLLRREYPSWIYPLTQGATAVWEHWNGRKPDGSFWSPNMNSFCHLTFGSVGEWLYGWVLGLRQEDGVYGYHRFMFAPAVDRRLEWAEGGFECTWGRIGAGWRFEGDGLCLSLRVPVGIQARAVLPMVRDPLTLCDQLAGNGYQVLSAEDSNVEVLCPSGTHLFRYAVPS